MNTKWVTMAMVAMVAMTGCGGDDNTNTVTSTPIPVGDDTATEMVDGVRDAGNDVNDSTFMQLWAATSFDTIDGCFDDCDETHPDANGNKSDANLECVAQCKIEFAE